MAKSEYDDYRNTTYADIEEACAKLKLTDIKGKKYAAVNERIKAFRKLYPTGYIHTQIKLIAEGVCVATAEIGFYLYADDGTQIKHVLGTGSALEKENSSNINRTSYWENAETSSVGRALGMAGIGIDTSIASSEEVENASYQQACEAKIDEREAVVLEAVLKEANVDVDKLLKQYKVKKLTELTAYQYGEINRKIAEWRETQKAQPNG